MARQPESHGKGHIEKASEGQMTRAALTLVSAEELRTGTVFLVPFLYTLTSSVCVPGEGFKRSRQGFEVTNTKTLDPAVAGNLLRCRTTKSLWEAGAAQAPCLAVQAGPFWGPKQNRVLIVLYDDALGCLSSRSRTWMPGCAPGTHVCLSSPSALRFKKGVL